MDHLDRLIQLAQIQGKIHTHCLLQGNWQLDNPSETSGKKGIFHILLKGECTILLGNQTLMLKAGDLFFLPRGLEHVLQSHPSKSGEEASTICQLSSPHSAYQTVQNGMGEAEIELFCGEFSYIKQATLIDNLPDFLHFSLKNTPLASLILLFKQEIKPYQQASRSVVDALSQVLFVYILRTYFAQHQTCVGVLNVLQDKRLAPVLNVMLQSPEQAWNVETLAKLANMSRANFLRVFQQKAGTSPTKLLTSLRLQQAALLLQKTQRSILSVALDVGYQSESHFSKAFKMAFGVAPSQYRKEQDER